MIRDSSGDHGVAVLAKINPMLVQRIYQLGEVEQGCRHRFFAIRTNGLHSPCLALQLFRDFLLGVTFS